MQIDDLTAGLSLSFIIHLNNEELQFESRILEVYSRRHTLLAEGVFTDDKIISLGHSSPPIWIYFPGKRAARRSAGHSPGR